MNLMVNSQPFCDHRVRSELAEYVKTVINGVGRAGTERNNGISAELIGL